MSDKKKKVNLLLCVRRCCLRLALIAVSAMLWSCSDNKTNLDTGTTDGTIDGAVVTDSGTTDDSGSDVMVNEDAVVNTDGASDSDSSDDAIAACNLLGDWKGVFSDQSDFPGISVDWTVNTDGTIAAKLGPFDHKYKDWSVSNNVFEWKYVSGAFKPGKSCPVDGVGKWNITFSTDCNTFTMVSAISDCPELETLYVGTVLTRQ